MSLTPQKSNIIKHKELQSHIKYESPSKNDINFYVRKTNRLQSQLSVLQQQLGQTKIRLRKAEDFQIKYDLVGKQNNNLLVENQSLVKEIQNLKVELEKQSLQIQDNVNRNLQFNQEKSQLANQILFWKNKFNQAEQSKIVQTVQKSVDKQKEGEQILKKEFNERQQRYEYEIRQLKRLITEKQTVENVIGMKVDRVRKEKDEEIARLNTIIEKQKRQNQLVLEEKRTEIEKISQKFQKMLNYQIENIHMNQDEQQQIFSIEISGLKEIIGVKNDQIHQLIDKLSTQTNQTEIYNKVLKDEINILKEKIYETERESELQLYNLKQRLSKIHAEDVKALDRRYDEFMQSFRAEKKQMEIVIKIKLEELDIKIAETEKVKEETADRLKQKDRTIEDLQEKLRDQLHRSAKQIEDLHQTFHKIETQKQEMVAKYEQSISFLTHQIKVLTSNSESKNRQIKYLQNESLFFKRSSGQANMSLDQKWKTQRREREGDRERFIREKEKLQNDWEMFQKEWKSKQKILEEQIDILQRQKSRLSFLEQELTKDNARLNQYIAQLDEALKRQFKKNQSNLLDANAVRRQMVNHLDKQKGEMEAIKRMQTDQITNKFQNQISRLKSDNQQLQSDLLNKGLAYDNLEGQYKKLQGTIKNMDKVKKDKLDEYERLMATLNSEINITKTLYDKFCDSKTRSRS